MKKIIYAIIILLIAVATFYLSYNYRSNQNSKTYYKVYLNNKVLGVIESQDKLNKYIDKQSENIKKKYKVNEVSSPVGLYVEKLTSYSEDVSNVEEVFNKILNESSLTINGYQINIKKDDKTLSIYVIDENVFKSAVENLIKTYVGSDQYNKYKSGTQDSITNTGEIIENIYVQNDISIKKVKIPVDQTIYTDVESLSHFLLYGDSAVTSQYTVQLGDTIDKVAAANQISPEEFLISNNQFTDKTNLLHAGQQVTISVTNPQLKVVTEKYEVVDKVEAYRTEERNDSSQYVGHEEVVQDGEDGVIRVTQRIQSVNGAISYIDPVSNEELKPAKSKIIIIGNKYVATVGDTRNWSWPSNPGYTISDNYQWRTNPITGAREHHSGIDIAGTGYGSPIYAANNGVVEYKGYTYDYGYHVIINHNNGYWTLYAHMSRFAKISVGETVARSQVIGYVGSTGYSTGPHLHFEVWKGKIYSRINPFSLFQ